MGNTKIKLFDSRNAWEVSESNFSHDNVELRETIFSQANGYIGLRGNFEESHVGNNDDGNVGAYINGFYESGTITYGESAFGYAKNSQTMLNVINGQIIRLIVENETFDMNIGKMEDYKRTLSLKTGVLTRDIIWTSPKGKKIRIHIERLVPFTEKHIAAIHYEVTPLNFSGKITLESAIDANVHNRSGNGDPRVGSSVGKNAIDILSIVCEKDYAFIVGKTKRSALALCCGMLNIVDADNQCVALPSKSQNFANTTYSVDTVCGATVKLDKYICYVDSREFGGDSLADNARDELNSARTKGFEQLKTLQTEYLESFWNCCNVEITGDEALQQGIRYNMFQLLQSAGTNGKTSVSSKGLSGEGYEGHYFWDTEMYVVPFFLYTYPSISRKLLEFRYNTLDNARERARELGHSRGALFPWRTITGEECSAYFPAGTAQYHIDADIAHAVRIYFEATNDEEFLRDYGAEILVETARLWADLGFFNENKDNKFCINCVTGPDEYNALVNNNCYTNLIAAENLRSALEALEFLKSKYPEHYRNLCDKVALTEDEPVFWRKAADNIYIPYDNNLGIHLQDDSFLDRQPWDFKNTPPENYPLLLHYHPLVIYRHSVCKQADMVLAMFLFGNLFDAEQKKRNYDFYEKTTTHDSSLSESIFCIVACELGYKSKAHDYFMNTARMDLDNCNGNTGDGIHTANMAGTWMCITYGFGGMRVYDGTLCFSPFLLQGWENYSFNITFRGSHIKVYVDGTSAVYTLVDGEPITLKHKGESIVLDKPGAVCKMLLG